VEPRLQLQEWMTRLSDGDRSAFRPVFDFLQPLLKRFVSSQVGAAECDDVAQQALLRIFERSTEFDPSLDALSWAFGIAAWEVRSTRKRTQRRREEPAEALQDHAHPARSPEDEAEAAQLRAAVLEALGTLNAADLDVLTRVAFGERLPGATFRKRVERALGRLRLAWSEKHGPR
jgi:RNA polymerase sigma-70 factor, ECF subfamily